MLSLSYTKIFFICLSAEHAQILWMCSNPTTDIANIAAYIFVVLSISVSSLFSIRTACCLYGFVGGLTGTVSITTLTAISLDRYFVIIYPLNPSKLGSKKWRPITMLCFIWTYSFAFAIMPALNIGLSRYTPEGFLTSCSFDYLDDRVSARIFMFAFFVGAWLIPLTTIVYCYAQIMREVSATGKIQSNRKRQRVEHKLMIVVVNVSKIYECVSTQQQTPQNIAA